MVSCDGGGGPLGHPRIFINVDKPQISPCNYCGLPFVSEHHRKDSMERFLLALADLIIIQAKNQHRKFLESLPSTPYPLKPLGDPAEVPESQRVSDEPLGQR